MSESVDPLAERCADCPAACAGSDCAVEPAPVLGPYIGLVGAVLCAFVGAFLLLAPYAFDYRDGAAGVPRSSVVDLATGGGVLLLGLLTAALFGGALARRLRAPEPETRAEPLPQPASAAAEAAAEAPDRVVPASEPEPHPAAPAASLADPGGALRDLLTPLVAALAADLRARESGETEGKHL